MSVEQAIDLSEVLNPLHLDGSEFEDYLRGINQLRDGNEGATPRFRGETPFTDMLRSRKIGIGITIRVYHMHGATIDPHYILTREGLQKLFPLDASDYGKTYSMGEILDPQANPDGWEITGQEFMADEELGSLQ